MDLTLIKTEQGLKPAFDADYEKYIKMKNGTAYKTKVVMFRNYEFHKKYFALINCAYSYQNEAVTKHFKDNVNLFRKTVEMSAGHCETAYSIGRKEWFDIPKSISFDTMDNVEFQELYESVKRVLFDVFIKVSNEEFERNLRNF